MRGDVKVGDYENNYKYTGKELDVETDLYYYGARYYDAEIGRFPPRRTGVSVDPWFGDLNDPQSLNKYAYVRNNPLKYVDPSGEFFFLAPLAVWAGEAIIGLAAVSGCAVMTAMIAESNIDDYNTATNWNSASTTNKAMLVTGMALSASPAGAVAKQADEAVDVVQSMRNGFAKRLNAQLEKGRNWLKKQEGVSNTTTLKQPKVGDNVWRISDPDRAKGIYWGPNHPDNLVNPRNDLGLPNSNGGTQLNRGVIQDTDGMIVKPADPLDGNMGGATEYKFKNSDNVKIIDKTPANY